MENLATIEDLKAFEQRIISHIDTLKELLSTPTVIKSITMTVGDVKKEYGYSEHTQRKARNKGHISFEKMGLKDITYKRTDVEEWIERKTIKSD